MKKFISIALTLTLVLSVMIIPVTANAATKSYNLVLGKTYTGEIEAPTSLYGISLGTNSHEYTFTMSETTNVAVLVASEGDTKTFSLKSTDYSFYASGQTPFAGVAYLKSGKTYKLTISGTGKYGVKVIKTDPDKLSMSKKSGKSTGANKEVPFTFTGSNDYARDNLSISTSKKKVADVSYSITGNNSGKIIIKPKYIGKTTITLKMKGSNSVKYTFYGTSGYWFVAKGSKAKAPAPAGVSKPKWKSSKKKVATIKKKTGKIKAKKGGRVTFTAKKGKVSYKIKTVVTDYIKLGKKTYKELKNTVNNPDKLKIYNVYKGYSKQIDSKFKIPVVVVDYGSTNDNGAMVRNKVMAYYDDVYQAHFTNGWSIDNIISRKSIKPSKIK
jgi:hypothetical protein